MAGTAEGTLLRREWDDPRVVPHSSPEDATTSVRQAAASLTEGTDGTDSVKRTVRTHSTSLPGDAAGRAARARLSLEGLSLGDAFGARVGSRSGNRWLVARRPPPPPWPHTDDTEMAAVIVGELERAGGIDPDSLAEAFARRYAARPSRGYGATTRRILERIADGSPWRAAAGRVFNGAGSAGNGAAMRAAPVGGYFADDPDRAAEQAVRSAEVTHLNPEGIAGAVAVAAAARLALEPSPRRGASLLEAALAFTPAGAVRAGLERAALFPLTADPENAARALGNGSRASAADTVPFCLWCAARHVEDYPAALWSAVSVGGHSDTHAAIVGGIVALCVGAAGLPADWLTAREPLVGGDGHPGRSAGPPDAAP